jgi:hypothetical protein
MRNDLRRAWPVILPSLGGLAGALIDERRNLGFTNWRAACRAAGPSLQSLLVFTRELLPSAVVGVLAGAFCIVLVAIVARGTEAARGCFAAHLGCFAAMPLMLAVCVLVPSAAAMLVADVVLGALAAMLVLRVLARRPRAPAAHP